MEKTFISLFGGIGGFDLALTRHGWKGVWYNDNDKYAVQTYNKNFGTEYEANDITTIKVNEIPDHTLLCGGFPCQPFSVAGKKKGFEDTRGTLFYEICRIIKNKRPPLLLLENVRGLLNHNEGKTFCTILTSLDELGYNVQWQVINSKYYTGQNRERVFIIGHSREISWERILPIPIKHEVNIKTAEDSWKKTFTCITTRSPKARTSIDATYIVDKKGVRSPTPLEYERLQGFPDGWTEGVSDAQRYKQLGNAVTVNVIESIVQRLNGCIE